MLFSTSFQMGFGSSDQTGPHYDLFDLWGMWRHVIATAAYTPQLGYFFTFSTSSVCSIAALHLRWHWVLRHVEWHHRQPKPIGVFRAVLTVTHPPKRVSCCFPKVVWICSAKNDLTWFVTVQTTKMPFCFNLDGLKLPFWLSVWTRLGCAQTCGPDSNQIPQNLFLGPNIYQVALAMN